MKKLLFPLLILPTIIFASDVPITDQNFADEYMMQFEIGMSIEDVRTILLNKKKTVQFYNKCTEEFEYPMTDCKSGYNLVATIILPGYETSLKRGDLQMYFTFNNKQILQNSFYEIYYTTDH